MTLAKKYRLGQRKGIKGRFGPSPKIRGSFFFIQVASNDLSYGRARIIVPLKVSKKATYRNKVRRLVSQIIKEHGLTNRAIDMVVNISPAIVDKTPGEIKSELDETIKKAFVNKG